MRQDLAQIQNKSSGPERIINLDLKKAESMPRPMPPKNLPTLRPQIKTVPVAAIIPVIQEKPIIQERVVYKEKIVKVIDEEKIHQIKTEYEDKLRTLEKYYQENPVVKIKEVEKIVEKPVIQERVVYKEKIVKEKDEDQENRSSKRIKASLILVIFLLAIGTGGYYLLKLDGNKMVINNEEPALEELVIAEKPAPMPETKPESVKTLIPTDGVHITKTEESLVNLPFYFANSQRDFVRFADAKMGLIIKVPNNLSTVSQITLWEKNMSQDLKDLFISQPAPNATFRINNWEFPNLIIRYQNTPDLENSIHYALSRELLIITTSETNMRLVLNNLWITP